MTEKENNKQIKFFLPKLRKLLELYKDELKTNNTEIADGMGKSRPTIIKFFKDETKELSFTREDLLNLWQKLCETQGNPERESLRTRGPDELLEAAGFLPEKNKSVRITPERFHQVGQLLALLDSPLLDFEDFFKISQSMMIAITNQLNKELKSNQNEEKDIIEEYLQKHPTLNLLFKRAVEEKYRKAIAKFKSGSTRNLTSQEQLGLYRSIAIKELTKDEEAMLSLRIIKYEFKSLSISLNKKDEYKDIYNQLQAIAISSERELGTPGINSEKELISIPPVTQAVITCRFGQENKLLKWSYTSSSTLLSNAINACGLNLGYSRILPEINISTRALGNNISSMIEANAVLGNNQNHKYQGIWVDRDMIVSVLEAQIIAAKKWLCTQINNDELKLNSYEELCEIISSLRSEIYETRILFQDYQFLEEKCESTYMSKIAKVAKQALEHQDISIESDSSSVYSFLKISLYRIYFLAKIQQLRLANIQGDLNEAKIIIDELTQSINEEPSIKQKLSPVWKLFESETQLYGLSCGSDSNLKLEQKPWRNWSEESHKEIIKTLSSSDSFYPDAGMDIFQSLSEIFGNSARLDFYLSTTKNEVEQAVNNFLKAAYYSSR
ncbi:MAG: hypothetical protein ACRCXZ_03370, partial [Patescibacteria group bacterium]